MPSQSSEEIRDAGISHFESQSLAWDFAIDWFQLVKNVNRGPAAPPPVPEEILKLARAFLAKIPFPPGYEPSLDSVEKVREAVAILPANLPESETFTYADVWKMLQVFSPLPDLPETESSSASDSLDSVAHAAVVHTDRAAVRAAFDQTNYLNTGAVLLLLQHLWMYARQWADTLSKFYAPYAALINASMTGKSRLVTELRKHGVFVMLICLRAETGSDYRPPRTPWVTEWVTRKDLGVSDAHFTSEVCAFFHAFVNKLRAFLSQRRELRKKGVKVNTSIEALSEDWFTYVYGEQQSGGSSLDFWQELAKAAGPDGAWNSFPSIRKALMEAEGVPQTVGNLDALIDTWRSLIEHLYTKIDAILADLVGTHTWAAEKQRRVNFLFVVDEARQLNAASKSRDRFVLFRRAMRCLPWNCSETHGNSFCVVTDTTSKVADLAPIKRFEKSFRIASHNGKKLFPPFTLVDTLDVYWDAAKTFPVRAVGPDGDGLSAALLALRHQLVPALRPAVAARRSGRGDQAPQVQGSPAGAVDVPVGMQKALVESFEVMATVGRPASYGFLVHRADVGDVNGFKALVALLQAKLLCQQPGEAKPQEANEEEEADEEVQADFGDFFKQEVDEQTAAAGADSHEYLATQVMAALGSIASVNISAASHMASELASGHMRLVAAISKQRKYVYTLEVPEPVFAYAAHCLILSGLMPWHLIIDKYAALVLNNTTDIGFRGEVAAQILCLAAWQKCLPLTRQEPLTGARLPAFEFPFIPALQYVKTLVGSSLFSQIPEDVRTGIERDLAGAFVRVNQFVKTYAELGLDTLKEFALRACGVYCKQGQTAVDFAIPLWFGPDFSNAAFSALLLQIKLRQEALSSADLDNGYRQLDSLPVLDEINPDLPSVAICLELGPARGAEAAVSNFNSRSGSAKTKQLVDAVHRPLIGSRSAKFAYALRIRGVSIANVLPEDTDAAEAFRRLLESTIDPSKSLNVEFLHRQLIPQVFKTVYMNGRTSRKGSKGPPDTRPQSSSTLVS